MASPTSTSTTKGRKPQTSKRSTTKAASAKPVAAIKSRTFKPAQPPKPNAKAKNSKNVELSKQELLERIITESGMKKGEARAALDAAKSGWCARKKPPTGSWPCCASS